MAGRWTPGRRSIVTKATYIGRRDDVNPTEGEREHGDVAFADPTNKKYPIDTPGHVRAAWNDINQEVSH